jgi:hypothetical protein
MLIKVMYQNIKIEMVKASKFDTLISEYKINYKCE